MSLLNPLSTQIAFSVLLTLAWRGWGHTLFRSLRQEHSSFGLEVLLGSALLVTLTFMLVLLEWGGLRGFFWTFLTAGFLMNIQNLRGKHPSPIQDTRWERTALLFLLTLVGLWCLTAAGITDTNRNDDELIYAPMARRLLESGTLDDPFSLRRLASYGGQIVFHSVLLLIFDSRQLHIWDQGLVPFFTFLLFLGLPSKSRTSRYLTWLLGVLVALHDHPRLNIAPQATSVWIFLGLLLTSELFLKQERPSPRSLLPFLLIGATFLSLRAHFLMTFGILTLTVYLSVRKKLAMRFILQTVFWCCVLVLPMAYLLYRSSGTPLFPVFSGNYDATFGTFWPNSEGPSALNRWWESVTYPGFITLFALSGMPYLLLPSEWRRFTLWILPGLLTALVFPLASSHIPGNDVFRYTSGPLLAGMALGLRLLLLKAEGQQSWIKPLSYRTLTGVAFIHLALNLSFFPSWNGVLIDGKLRIEGWKYLQGDSLARAHEKAISSDLRELLKRIPEQARLLAGVAHTEGLDFRRHQVWMVDIPGNVSPLRPLRFKDLGASLSSLQSSGIQWILMEDPGRIAPDHIYSLQFWQRIKAALNPYDYHYFWKPRFLEFFAFQALLRRESECLLSPSGRFVAIAVPSGGTHSSSAP